MTKVIFLRVSDELHQRVLAASRDYAPGDRKIYNINRMLNELLEAAYPKDAPPTNETLRDMVIRSVSRKCDSQKSRAYICGFCNSHPLFSEEALDRILKELIQSNVIDYNYETLQYEPVSNVHTA